MLAHGNAQVGLIAVCDDAVDDGRTFLATEPRSRIYLDETFRDFGINWC